MNWQGFRFLRERRIMRAAVNDAYDELNRQARHPWLYSEGGVEDTLEGRFNALAAVSGVLFTTLSTHGSAGERLAQRLYKKAFDGLDAALRETGVGDASIARKIRKFGERYFGIGQAVRDALKSSDPKPALILVLERNEICAPQFTDILSAHLLRLAESFDQKASTDWLSGNTE